jgi:translation initiation factor IF-2
MTERPPPMSTREMAAHKKVIKIEGSVTLATLAGRMGLKANDLLVQLIALGARGVHVNSTLDADTAKLLAGELGWTIEDVEKSDDQIVAEARGDAAQPGALVARPPVVTVMGHVDHGKTSLLDRIRSANVAAGEAGGITQHIGAYRVSTPRGTLTFLDTPGHEAFSAMRARGARVTDIVVLVVAADDGVMPQTREAIEHARAARVPIVVAINKIDRPDADAESVMRKLSDLGLVPEAWGGETLYCRVSARTGEGIEGLLDALGLQAEMLELFAGPSRPATGTVLEALRDKGRGAVARVLVQDGTLRAGDVVLCGAAWGKVRAMIDERGRALREAGPGTPVELLGLSDVPGAGDRIDVVKDARKAQAIAERRREEAQRAAPACGARVSRDDLSRRLAEAERLELRVVLKADVQGSVEALGNALTRLSTARVRLTLVHAGVGAITEGDIGLAAAAKAQVWGFRVRPVGKAQAEADAEGIAIRTHAVIYDVIDDVRSAMIALLAPERVETVAGKAEVRQVFGRGKAAVAGCLVVEGSIARSADKARLLRGGAVVWEGRISGLRRFKDDVARVERGLECGVALEGGVDVQVGDVIACVDVEEIAPTL